MVRLLLHGARTVTPTAHFRTLPVGQAARGELMRASTICGVSRGRPGMAFIRWRHRVERSSARSSLCVGVYKHQIGSFARHLRTGSARRGNRGRFSQCLSCSRLCNALVIFQGRLRNEPLCFRGCAGECEHWLFAPLHMAPVCPYFSALALTPDGGHLTRENVNHGKLLTPTENRTINAD